MIDGWNMRFIAVCLIFIGVIPTDIASASACAELAAPQETATVGVRWAELDADTALGVCETELAADPENDATRAHLARVLSKLDRKDDALRVLDGVSETTQDPAALAYLALTYDAESWRPVDLARAVSLFEKAAARGSLFAQSNLAAILLRDGTPLQDVDRGRALRRDAADRGHPAAAYRLARRLMYTEKAEADAIRYYRIAAEGRDARAMAELVRAYYYGVGVEIDGPQAFAWAERGASAGNSYAMMQLGRMYRDGFGTEQNVPRAAELLTAAGDAGRSGAFIELGLLEEGRGRPRAAVHAQRKASAMGNATATINLSKMYHSGTGVPKDYNETARLAALALTQTDDPSSFILNWVGDMHRQSVGTVADKTKAAAHYKKSAEAGDAFALFRLGNAYLNGDGVDKDEARGAKLLLESAQKGEVRAMLPLGWAYANGRGVPANTPKAIEWYVKHGSKVALSNIGGLYETGLGIARDPEHALYWFRKSAEKDHVTAIRATARLLEERGSAADLREAVGWLAKGLGHADAASEARLDAAFANPRDPLFPYLDGADLVGHFLNTARRYEEVFVGCIVVLIDCGKEARYRLDLSRAAQWYRRAGETPIAQMRLGRLLRVHPQFEAFDGEGIKVLKAAATKGNPAAALMVALAEQPSAETIEQTVANVLDSKSPAVGATTALRAVIGQFGDDAIGPAWLWLDKRAATGDARASAAMVGVLSFFGDFDGAANRLEQSQQRARINLALTDYTLRQSLLFLMDAVRDGVTPDPEQLGAMDRLLALMAERRVEGAEELALMLEEVRYRIDTRDTVVRAQLENTVTPEMLLDRIDTRIAEKMKGAGLSPHLVQLHRSRAEQLAVLGNTEEAEKATYQALAIAQQVNDQTRHLRGSLVYHMEMACNTRKAADALFKLGADKAGLALAKTAVNHLQSARRTLLGLPQELQSCFRDALADQYRRIADMLIRAGHEGEARAVLDQLKSFEAFRYSAQSADQVGAGLDDVALTEGQSRIVARIHGLPIAQMVALEAQRAALDSGDTAGLEAIEVQLDAANLALADSLTDLRDEIDALETDAGDARADAVSLRKLRRLGSRLGKLDDVAMVYSVSLPDRTHFLVVTADGTQHLELPIQRADLQQKIIALRAVMANPASDPRPLAEDFYNTVWASVDAALTQLPEGGQVLLSLDGAMRYVPVGALRNGDGWLMQRLNYVAFTSASAELLMDDSDVEDLQVEALGASKGTDEFAPLDYVRYELNQIVGSNGDGLLPGRVRLDDGFDARGLQEALSSGAPLVHLATHFDLTEMEDSSRLLLGSGDTLSVAALQDGARRGRYALEEVRMLVLSACRTGVGGGSEIESLASVLQSWGVETVVATLWPVADRSTALFMTAFYAQLKEGHSRAEALRRAQIGFATSDASILSGDSRAAAALEEAEPTAPRLSALEHPFFWAGFQMLGQWRPLQSI